jgi:NADH:ubiquinone oxidoreductase subunit 6 (subunit J)
MSDKIAAITNPAVPNLESHSGVSFIESLLRALVSIGFIVGGVVFLFIFLMGAIQWISSGSDKSAQEQARGRLTSALVGIIILFALYAIIKVVEYFFGISILLINVEPLRI